MGSSHSCCSTIRAGMPAPMTPATSSSWTSRIAVDGTGSKLPKRFRLSSKHCAAGQEHSRWRQRSPPSIARRPSPIVSLNRAVAVAMVEGPRPALALIDKLAATGELDGYHLLHATRADLLRRLGISADAAASYARALALVSNNSERRFLERRLREMQALDS